MCQSFINLEKLHFTFCVYVKHFQIENKLKRTANWLFQLLPAIYESVL